MVRNKLTARGLANGIVRELAAIILTPLADRAWAAGFEMSRAMPRSSYSLDKTGSARTVLITEPPWAPVAPKTVKTLGMVMNCLVG